MRPLSTYYAQEESCSLKGLADRQHYYSAEFRVALSAVSQETFVRTKQFLTLLRNERLISQIFQGNFHGLFVPSICVRRASYSTHV